MVINKQFILVRIDKPKQIARREKMGSIFLAEKWNYMKRNLQYGEVIQIGPAAAEKHPGLQIGDTAIFKHIIEEEDWRLLYRDYNKDHPYNARMKDEYRVVDTTNDLQLFGYIKPDGTLIASDIYLFCSPDIKLIATDIVSSLFIESDLNTWSEDKWAEETLSKLAVDKENITTTIQGERDAYKFENLHAELTKVAMQMEKVSQFMHAPKLCWITIDHISDNVSREMNLHAGQTIVSDKMILYPLELMGRNYYLVHYDYIMALRN